jgi:uncharacterized protein YdeI (YjbR/CyaY-like superfamily)
MINNIMATKPTLRHLLGLIHRRGPEYEAPRYWLTPSYAMHSGRYGKSRPRWPRPRLPAGSARMVYRPAWFTDSVADDLPVMSFGSPAAWEAWLIDNHAVSAGLWLKIAKRDAAEQTVSYAEAVELALCFGWIDGRKGALDEVHWLQRFTPRKQRSKWSKINRDNAAALIAAGRMHPAGLREVELAQADGRWDAAYEGQRTSTVPPDLAQALAENDTALAFFGTLSSANRYAILYRIGDAKRPETRARRIATYVAMLAEHKTFHPQ